MEYAILGLLILIMILLIVLLTKKDNNKLEVELVREIGDFKI